MVINFRNKTEALCAIMFGLGAHSSHGIIPQRSGGPALLYTNYQATLESPPVVIKPLAAFE